MTGKKRHFVIWLSQQVLSRVVANTLHVHEVGSYNQSSAKSVCKCWRSFSIGHWYIAKRKKKNMKRSFADTQNIISKSEFLYLPFTIQTAFLWTNIVIKSCSKRTHSYWTVAVLKVKIQCKMHTLRLLYLAFLIFSIHSSVSFVDFPFKWYLCVSSSSNTISTNRIIYYLLYTLLTKK